MFKEFDDMRETQRDCFRDPGQQHAQLDLWHKRRCFLGYDFYEDAKIKILRVFMQNPEQVYTPLSLAKITGLEKLYVTQICKLLAAGGQNNAHLIQANEFSCLFRLRLETANPQLILDSAQELELSDLEISKLQSLFKFSVR